MAKPFPCQMANFFQICKWTFFPISTFAIIEEMTTSRRCLQCIIRAKLASQNHLFQRNWDQYEVDWNPRSNDIKLPEIQIHTYLCTLHKQQITLRFFQQLPHQMGGKQHFFTQNNFWQINVRSKIINQKMDMILVNKVL